jgi:hypothetical protein
MKIGVLKITEELMETPYWHSMYAEIRKHFTEMERRFNGFGPYWEIVGTSDLFDDVIEGEKPNYIPIFKDTKEIEFQEFQKCS